MGHWRLDARSSTRTRTCTCTNTCTSTRTRTAGILLGCMTMMTACSSSNASSLTALWEDASRKCDYVTPTAEELGRAEELFKRTLQRKEDLSALQGAWAALHFELIPVREESMEFLALREGPDHKTGRGFYLFYLGQAPAITFEAPHSAFDEHTGEIALNLMTEGRAAAAAWSTAARQKGDLAHLPESYFQSFTAAVAQTSPRGAIIQLHGFDQKKRKSMSAAAADMIVSSGLETPPGWIRNLADGLKRSIPGTVKLYPDEVRDLGATGNAQGQLLHSLKHDGFAHIEMSMDLRLKLTQDRAVRKAFLDCAAAALRDVGR